MAMFLKSRRSWLAAPVLFAAAALVLLAAWAAHTPEWVRAHFDADGASPVESATIGFFFLAIGLLWLLPAAPAAAGPRRRLFWRIDFSLILLTAIGRELDWHRLLVTASGLPGATRGTPFKMRFLTNPVNPLSDRLIVLAVFLLFLAVCGGTLAYFIRRLWKGLFKLDPVSWTIGFLGGAGALSQVFDRMPSILRKKMGVVLSDSAAALFTAFEEGLEVLIPLFAILAILQAHLLLEPAPRE